MRHCSNTRYLMVSVVFDRTYRLERLDARSLRTDQIHVRVRLCVHHSIVLTMSPVVQCTLPRDLTTRGLGSCAPLHACAGYATSCHRRAWRWRGGSGRLGLGSPPSSPSSLSSTTAAAAAAAAAFLAPLSSSRRRRRRYCPRRRCCCRRCLSFVHSHAGDSNDISAAHRSLWMLSLSLPPLSPGLARG